MECATSSGGDIVPVGRGMSAVARAKLAGFSSNLDTTAVFCLRDFQSKDLEKLYRLDQECFEAGISYSRAELSSFIQRRGSFCIVAELENEWISGRAQATP